MVNFTFSIACLLTSPIFPLLLLSSPSPPPLPLLLLTQFVPKTHLLFSGSKDWTIKCWDADHFEHVMTLEVCVVCGGVCEGEERDGEGLPLFPALTSSALIGCIMQQKPTGVCVWG